MEEADLTEREHAALELLADALEDALPAMRVSIAKARADFENHQVRMSRLRRAVPRYRRMMARAWDRDGGNKFAVLLADASIHGAADG